MQNDARQLFAQRHPKMSFMHIYPGFVKTPNVKRNANWALGLVATVLQTLMARSMESSGEYMVYCLCGPRYKTGGWALDKDCEAFPPEKVHLSEEGSLKVYA